ncbi:ANTAR domain-containing response regulator [Phenylobacterium sp.]|jgi:response regulator NasT|uniref:ANTAR domain-containing response regulator n=1 Tax=Phenylobacterium sp. TaxID=1871053 RepID=UPI002F953A64
MRVLIVDPDAARAALVAEGLAGVEPLEVRRASVFHGDEAAAFEPDVIVVALDSPDRDVIDSLRDVTEANPRPVVMFVDRSEPGFGEAALRAGVSAYVVDGLSKARVRDVLEVAMTRFQLMSQLRDELAKAKADLASRKTIERAKALIMQQRGLDEPAAYALLRRLSMETHRAMAVVAADLLALAGALKEDGR